VIFLHVHMRNYFVKKVFFVIMLFATLQSSFAVAAEKVIEPKYTLYIELKDGIVVAELFPNIAPTHVQRIKRLVADGFYDGLKFHRAIPGFMVQTGDPTGTGRGGSRLGKLYAEISKEHHVRGTLSMARAADLNSANSQFFIVTGEFFPELDGQYTIFGRVVEGMEFVDKIKMGDMSNNGAVTNPDVMIKVVTGDMLSDKPLSVVKEAIKIATEAQNEKIKRDSNYKKQSILNLLLTAKDIDVSAETPGPAQPAVNTGVDIPADTAKTIVSPVTVSTPPNPQKPSSPSDVKDVNKDASKDVNKDVKINTIVDDIPADIGIPGAFPDGGSNAPVTPVANETNDTNGMGIIDIDLNSDVSDIPPQFTNVNGTKND